MSVNRPRSLSRQNTPRALTLPTTYDNSNMHCSTTSLNAAGVSELSTYLPSTDESLQDWLTRNLPEANSPSPLSSLMNETCPCCDKYDCENMDTLQKTMKRLEADACLAAQIGQSLLQKHESLVAETNQTKGILEQQLNEFREKVANLEILLVDADNSKQESEEERDRYHWKWQKSQKALEETSVDLEKANKRCIEIGQELQNKTKELEKLRIFKFMVRQADFREDMLRSQLEDTNQELAISRKNELMLESKYKKLKSRYETVCTTCEKLRTDGQTLITTNGNNNNTNSSNSRRMDYLLESNEQLQNNIIKLTSMLSDQSSLSTSPPSEQGYLITLIKELTMANAKLKMDLLDGNLLAFEEHMNGPMGVDDEELPEASPPCASGSPPNYGAQHLTTINSNDESSPIPSTPPQMTSLFSNQGIQQGTTAVNRTIEVNENTIPTKAPSPTTSSSLPTSSKHGAVHYHYHYNSHKAKRPLSTMFRRSYNILNKDEKAISNLNFESTTIPKVTLSPTSDEDELTTQRNNDANPYDQLEKHASLVYDRLKSTDIRSLNRRLKRAFDIMELSSMSNSIIDNILNDILLLEGQFLWVKTDNDNINDRSNSSARHHPTSAFIFSAFFPTLTLLQSMLTEIGELRMTMNDLQLEYVKKVEEMDQLAERDVLRKRQENEKATAALASDHQNSRSSHGGGGRAALAWLSNVFHLQTPSSSASTSATKTMTTSTTTTTITSDSVQQRSIRYQRSFDSMFTATRDGMTMHNNNNRPLATTTSSSLRIKQKKHDFDCFGPSSSLPRSASMNEQKRRKRSGSSQAVKQYGHPLRPSVSAGPVRKSVASPGIWSSSAPPIPSSASPPPTPSSLPPSDNKTVQRKRSLLGLGSGFKESLDKLDSSSSNSSEWKLGTSFGGSWLGT